MPFTPEHRTVLNEGCTIHYWFQGTGPLLIMVPGGGGCGRTYNPIFEHLSQKFTVCTLDRRQSGQSKVQGPNRLMNPSQQVRDILAVVHDMGATKTNLFGNSGGGILALQFAVEYPQYVDHVVSHEAPTALLLPDRAHVFDTLYRMKAKAQDEGAAAGFGEFRAMQKGFEDFPERVTGGTADVENFLENEFLVFALYCPDLRRVVQNGVKVVVGAGVRSGDAFYARTALEQRDVLGCGHVVFPGNHAGFELEPAEFADRLVEVLEGM